MPKGNAKEIGGLILEAITLASGVPKLSNDEQEQVSAIMGQLGHPMTWDAIRYARP